MEGGRTVMSDDVDRHAPNPNRVTQPFDRIGKGDDMSEIEARERYYWSKIRQDLKAGHVEDAAAWFDVVSEKAPHLYRALEIKVAATFTAGCIALGDPAPLDKEQYNG